MAYSCTLLNCKLRLEEVESRHMTMHWISEGERYTREISAVFAYAVRAYTVRGKKVHTMTAQTIMPCVPRVEGTLAALIRAHNLMLV